MSSLSRPRSIITTDWAARVDSLGPSRNGFVHQLLMLSLLYDEILIPDELLILSNPLAEWFSNYEGSSLWNELLDIGSIVILTHPKHAYLDEDLHDLSIRHPFEARSKFIERHGSKYDSQFSPTPVQEKFHVFNDFCLRNSNVKTLEPGQRNPREIMPQFQATLLKVLSDNRYSQWLQKCFNQLNADDLKQFHDCVADPIGLVEKLKKIDLNSHVIYQNGSPVLNRSLANLATKLFSPEKRLNLRHLIASTFAAPFCWRENAVGQYSKLLRAIPNHAPVEDFEPEETKLDAIVEVQAKINVPLGMPEIDSGLVKIISEIRETKVGQELRRAVSLQDQSTSFEEQKDAWCAVAEELALRVVKPRPVDVSLYSIAKLGTDIAVVGAIAHSLHKAQLGQSHDLLDLVSSAGLHAAVGLSYEFLHQYWGQKFDCYARAQKMCFQIESAIEFQCIWVSEPKNWNET